MPTYWNGDACEAKCVRVVVGLAPAPTWWCAGMRGTERNAVRVKQGDDIFYLDNEDGSGWAKVTLGYGSPQWGHRSLPVEREI